MQPQPILSQQANPEKARLRAEALSLRKTAWLKSAAPAAEAIAGRGMLLVPSLNVSGAVAGYHALRAELDPLPLLGALHAHAYALALPCLSEGAGLIFREWAPGRALQPKKFGVCEPDDTAPLLQPSVLLVPLLAFDRRGNRLGYGAGCYDACLRSLRAQRRVIAIGVAFDEQELPEIPREPQDEPLDMVLTPSRVIACGM